MKLFELFATLGLDDTGFSRGIKKVSMDFQGLGGAIKSGLTTINSAAIGAGKMAYSAGQQIISTMSKTVLAGGTAMATGLTAFAKIAVEAAAQVAAENAQFEAAFKTLGDTAQKTYAAIGKEANILTSRLKATGTKGFSQFKGAGLEANEALDASSRLLRLAADGAAYYDISLEAADERLRSFIRGNTEAGDAIGLFTSESQRNARAMEMYRKKYVNLTEAQKQLLMLNVAEEIYRQSGATGQAAREGHEYANVMSNLVESYRQLKAAMGEPIKNAIIPVMEGITASLDSFKTAFEQSGIKGLADAVGESLDDAFAIVREKGPGAIESGFEVGNYILTGLNQRLPEMVATGEAIFESVRTGFSSAVPLIAESAKTLAPSILSGVISFKGDMLSAGIEILGWIAKGITENKNQITGAISEAVKNVTRAITENLPAIVAGGLDVILAIVQGIAENKGEITNAVSTAISAIGTWVASPGNLASVVSAGVEIAKALIKGIASGLKNLVVDVGIAIGDETLNLIDSIFGTNLYKRSQLASKVGPAQADAVSELWMDTSNMPSLKPVSYGPNNVIPPTNLAQYIPIPGSSIGGLKDYEEALAKVKETAGSAAESIGELQKTTTLKSDGENSISQLKEEILSLDQAMSAMRPFGEIVNEKEKYLSVLSDYSYSVEQIKAAFSDTEMPSTFWDAVSAGAETAKSSIDQANKSVKQFLANNGKNISLGATISISQNGYIRGGGVLGVKNIALREYATGLDYVPMNNYVARLHRGEMVLTAQEAEDYRAQRKDRRTGEEGVTVIQNIQAVPMTPRELAFQTANALESLRFGL